METKHVDIITQAEEVARDAEVKRLDALAEEELLRLIRHGSEETQRAILILTCRNCLCLRGVGQGDDENKTVAILRDLLG